MHQNKLDDSKRVALVTGAGSGIGRATALRLAQDGCAVGLLGRTKHELERVAEDIQRANGEAIVLVADVADSSSMRAGVETLIAWGGRLDIVVANAGVNGVWAPIDELQPQEWDQTMAINLRGTYLTVHLTVPHLRRSGGGSIVVVSSINGTRTFTSPGATAYSATKAGQLAMVQQLAVELGPDRIRINAVCPGAIETAIDDNTNKRATERLDIPQPSPRQAIPLTHGTPGTAQEVADLIGFLASDAARHISGTPVWIDGAQSLIR
ncbi:SDR family oxidoreductase [Agrobacterium vitis]|uniref:SDR family oxidoreductase n=1 Tax=Rhizobium/Agrobacterium group TaxID=227290 RepID=UPI0012E8877C|nr:MULTISPECIES: SDR family NAD(P)-dependent oxidoreductase [Rhizobium/Agrobacterium group]MCF1474438.1 SDR family oxidoreductase [Allorhizobium ampelinum]MVA51734.1 SDR family oxidoreductase [Agrobacterium vitis]